jgi:hypothetical protein
MVKNNGGKNRNLDIPANKFMICTTARLVGPNLIPAETATPLVRPA